MTRTAASLDTPVMRVLGAAVVAAILLSACGLNSRGPWVDANGQQLQGNQVIEYDGFAVCNHERVIFLEFFGAKYAKDEEARLGTLRADDGAELTFLVGDTLPPSAEATGITHAGREIFVGDDREDYLYIRLPSGQVERWPRAEVECDRI